MLLRLLKDLVWRGGQAADERKILDSADVLITERRHEEAIRALTPLLERDPNSVRGLVLRGSARSSLGQLREARADLRRAADLAPQDALCLYELASVMHRLGDDRAALDYCARARRLAPHQPAAYFLQARIRFAGEPYLGVIERIIAHVQPRTYVEIGVFMGESLRLATPPIRAVGVDPEPRLPGPPAHNHKVFAETSDGFFARHDLRAELGGLSVDLAFIDGLHLFDFALRDFANLERHCTRGSSILIHDCYPLDRESAGREPRPNAWSGDIWRLIVLLKKYRPDLAVHVIGTPPTGLGLVRNLDPDSRFLGENHDRLRDEFLALDYSYLDEDMPGKLNLIPNEWNRIVGLLS